jgi:hypothetical protein
MSFEISSNELTTATITLQTEVDAFERLRMTLLNRSRGKYALLKGRDVVDTFESELEAIREGYRRFGNESFLVKHIVETDVPITLTSLTGLRDSWIR